MSMEENEKFSTPQSTPRRNGSGDGIRQTVSAKKRVPVPSSRKFTTKLQPKDDGLKLKLAIALEELNSRPAKHSCIKKASTIAEITPTKSRAKNKTNVVTGATTLHATPRPLDALIVASRRRCPRERAVCALYQRLMLSAWRRTKERLDASVETQAMHREQIVQLEMQIEVLKNLRNSECQKRDEALSECQKFRKKCEILELENSQLCEETQNLQMNLENTQDNLKSSKIELKATADQLFKLQEYLKKKNEQKLVLLDKLSKQSTEIMEKNITIQRLEENLEISEKNLTNTQNDFKIKQDEYDALLREHKKNMEHNSSLMRELHILNENKTEIEFKATSLENHFSELLLSFEEIKEENEYLKGDVKNLTLQFEMEKKRSWFRNTKDFALLSLSALQKMAYVMLPAYLDAPEREY